MREAFDTFVRVLEQCGCKPHVQGLRANARCPAHEDSSPSLSVRCAGDGRVLVHCHAGCETPAVLAALGADWKILFVDDGWPEGGVVHFYKPDRESLAILNDVLGPVLNEGAHDAPIAQPAQRQPSFRPRRWGARWA